MKRSKVLTLAHQTCMQFLDNGGPLLGAALSFYALLSIGPLLLVVLSVARYALSHLSLSCSDDLYAPIAAWMQPQAARGLTTLLDNFRNTQAVGSAGFFGSIVLLWSATRLLRQLQDALHQLWHVRSGNVSVGRSVWAKLKQQGMALGMLLLCGGLLVLSVAMGSAAAVLRGAFKAVLPGSELLWSTMTLGTTILVLSTLFALVLRVLPAVTVAWRDAWVGALATAVAFSATQYPLSYYLGHQGVPGFFGAAGSFVMFLVWVYYAAQLFFLGAQFTLVWAQAHGRGLQDKKDKAYIAAPVAPLRDAEFPEALLNSPALMASRIGARVVSTSTTTPVRH